MDSARRSTGPGCSFREDEDKREGSGTVVPSTSLCLASGSLSVCLWNGWIRFSEQQQGWQRVGSLNFQSVLMWRRVLWDCGPSAYRLSFGKLLGEWQGDRQTLVHWAGLSAQKRLQVGGVFMKQGRWKAWESDFHQGLGCKRVWMWKWGQLGTLPGGSPKMTWARGGVWLSLAGLRGCLTYQLTTACKRENSDPSVLRFAWKNCSVLVNF